jgi:hypothetical protein
MRPSPEYTVSPWPVVRNLTTTGLDFQPSHTYHGWTAVNVTQTLAALSRCQRATRIHTSLHAYLIRCIAIAAAEYPAVITYRHRNKLITFKTVDIGTAIDKKQPDGTRLPVIHIARDANLRSFAKINWEFRHAAQSDPLRNPDVRARRRFAHMPGFLRHAAFKRAISHPVGARRLYGNLQFTSLYHSGVQTPFVAFPPNLGTVSVAAGSVSDMFLPDAEGRPQLSRVLHFGGAMNHDVIDGMQLIQFLRRATELIETCTELDDDFIAETNMLKATSQARKPGQ